MVPPLFALHPCRCDYWWDLKNHETPPSRKNSAVHASRRTKLRGRTLAEPEYTVWGISNKDDRRSSEAFIYEACSDCVSRQATAALFGDNPVEWVESAPSYSLGAHNCAVV